MTASHQTVRLARGRHRSPAKGACAMELASMLAGEPFSDRPSCVSPVIGAFMRAYNDRIDDEDRQGLYRYAAMAVGTADLPEVERARVHACIEWAAALAPRRRFRPGLLGRVWPLALYELAGRHAAALAAERGDPSLLERLCRLGRRRPDPSLVRIAPQTRIGAARR